MSHLSVNEIISSLRNLYSYTSIHTKYQIEIHKSFILMLRYGFISIKNRIKKLHEDTILVILLASIPIIFLHLLIITALSIEFSLIFTIIIYLLILKSLKLCLKIDLRKVKNLIFLLNLPLKLSLINFYLGDNNRPELFLQ